jgi:hypothetical protein
MRSTYDLWGHLEKELKKRLKGTDVTESLGARQICEVELGLYLLSQLAPSAPARALWVLLTGYDFPLPELQGLNKKQHNMWNIVRHILLHFKNARHWEEMLERYRNVDERLRLYEVDSSYERFTKRIISIEARREEVYCKVAQQPLPHVTRKIRWAEAGNTYLCADKRKRHHVTIPPDMPIPPLPQGHNLCGKKSHPPILIPWNDLLTTAQWMDDQLAQGGYPKRDWYKTMLRVRLHISEDENSEFVSVDTLQLGATMHVVGMVSSGKSTLMDVLAVWASRHGYHITLVVGDVIAVFERVQQFVRFGLKAAPILGASNRRRHADRLHRALTAEQSQHPLLHQHIGFNYTSSACLLDGLRNAAKPFEMEAVPCMTLVPLSSDEDAEETPSIHEGDEVCACPFYSNCPYHQAQLDLVEATIWVATPASLVYTNVAPQLNPERLRFLELVYRRSDIVVIDEVDRVQVQLDQIFSPSLTLMSRGKDSWLGSILQKVTQRLSEEGLGQFRYEEVKAWAKELAAAQGAVYSIYDLLLNEPVLYNWVERGHDYFSGLTLLEKLTIELTGIPKDPKVSPYKHKDFETFWIPFKKFLDDPLGDRRLEEHDLAQLARQVIAVRDKKARQALLDWLKQQKTIALSEQELRDYALRLEFAIMLEVLSDRLDTLIRQWKQVEAILGLEGSSPVLFHRPPEDYAALIPDAPMGNILGFQYLRPSDDPNGPGDLRFFRCMGVGRWLILHLHDLFASDGLEGPHTLLLSGTSWAGTSPSYHVQVPVTGVLLAPNEEVEAINKSTFELKILLNNQQQPIEISGKKGHQRLHALQEMLYALSYQEKMGSTLLPSLLEQKRDELPPERQRILLLVGSYDEAEKAYQFLAEKRRDWEDHMVYLVSDDDEFESEWRTHHRRLQRGMVDRFARTGAWLLIAPLLAVERGHNILNEDKKAAIGAVYFLIRPHPRPDDINYIIHAINRWAVEMHQDLSWFTSQHNGNLPNLEEIGKAFRTEAFRQWRYLVRMPLRYSTLPYDARRALIWSQQVSIWQVIGRLVRGGCEAQVFFCDAKFAPRTAQLAEEDEGENTSLLFGMREVLRPYFESAVQTISRREKDLVRILYEPLYRALDQMEGIY